MKVSAYNFFYKHPSNSNEWIAYNSFSNSLALMDEDQYEEYERFAKDSGHQMPDSLVEELQKGRFVIDDDVDEIALIRHGMYASRYATNGLGLTLAPTSACNFRCVYCYEKENMTNDRMTSETQQAVVDFVKRKADYLSKLHISWYGGEPLLALDIIESLSKRFLRLAEAHHFEYSASIVTNGYLLTPENARRLLDCKVTGYQVTIDGEAQTHNARRPLACGQPTYDTIMNNLQNLRGVLPFISLRVNLDRDNSNAINAVTEYLKRHQMTHVRAYPGRLQNTNDCYVFGACFVAQDFFEFEYDYIQSTHDDRMMLGKYPTRIERSCCADTLNAYVINADGAMYKCWSDIGIPELSIGKITESTRNLMNEIVYLKNDPTQDAMCRNCKFLPICMGGCPHSKREKINDRCLHYSRLHEKYIAAIAQIMQRRT